MKPAAAKSFSFRRLSPLFAGFADQSLISVSSFVCFVLVARSVSLTQLGVFSILLALILFVVSLQNGLIVVPHTILSSGLTGFPFQRVTSVALGLQLILSVITLLFFIAGQLLTSGLAPDISVYLPLAGLTCSMWQLQDFLRRVLYAGDRTVDALLNNLVNYLLQNLILVSLWMNGELTIQNTLATMALSSMAAILVGVLQSRQYLTVSAFERSSLPLLREIWSKGRWLAGGSLLGLLTGQTYIYLTASFTGLGATGALRSAQALWGPTSILVRFIDASLTPPAVQAFSSGGNPSLHRFIRKVAIVSIPLLVTIMCASLGARAGFFTLLFGTEVAGYSNLVIPTAASACFVYLTAIGSLGLRAQGVTKPTFVALGAALLVNLTLGPFLVRAFGVFGASLGLLLNSVLMCLVTWVYYLRISSTNASAEADGVSAPPMLARSFRQ